MQHWDEDDLIHWMYGLQTDESHLNDCPDCRSRADALALRRAALAETPEMPWDFMMAQRRSIYRRLGHPLRNWAPVRWAASLATLVMVAALSVAMLRHDAATAPLVSPADQKLYSDLVSIDQSNEPRAIKPIHSLFEE